LNEFEMNCYNAPFTHIYIEKRAYDSPVVQRILDSFSGHPYTPILIDHYKDIFNRQNQSFHLQKKAPALILAVKEGRLVYEGAPVCQSFGHEHFYYTSCMMNCIYNCEYCYLQGMYPSGNIVVFVNLYDIFHEVENLLKQHPVYLCISYDTDLLAMESKLGIVHEWMNFAKDHKDLTIELRTKSANLKSILDVPPNDRFILAWTLSPDEITCQYEHQTPHLEQRLKNIKKALETGYPVRLCFDPMIYVPDWQYLYHNLINTVSRSIDLTQVTDISIGIFRIGADYMTAIRRQRRDSAIIQYPYYNDHGVFHLDNSLAESMLSFMKQELIHYVSEDRLFFWEL